MRTRKERRGLYRLPGDDVNPLSRLGIAAERLRSPSPSLPRTGKASRGLLVRVC